ncbi:hypothetical protein HV144_16415 [Citrobacter freundii]|nr:hypothetical protein [Citrobacter freundii]
MNNELAALIIDKRFTEHHRCPSLLTETEVESSTVIVIKPDMYGLRNITPHLYLYLAGGQLLPLYLARWAQYPETGLCRIRGATGWQ